MEQLCGQSFQSKRITGQPCLRGLGSGTSWSLTAEENYPKRSRVGLNCRLHTKNQNGRMTATMETHRRGADNTLRITTLVLGGLHMPGSAVWKCVQ